MDDMREAVTRVLDQRGVLNTLKAELRANVFLAIHEHDGKQGGAGLPAKTDARVRDQLLSSPEGMMLAELVHEFLQICDLQFTAKVYEPEMLRDARPLGRQALQNHTGLSDASPDEPLLLPLLLKALALAPGKAGPPASAGRGISGSQVQPPPAPLPAKVAPQQAHAVFVGPADADSDDGASSRGDLIGTQTLGAAALHEQGREPGQEPAGASGSEGSSSDGEGMGAVGMATLRRPASTAARQQAVRRSLTQQAAELVARRHQLYSPGSPESSEGEGDADSADEGAAGGGGGGGLQAQRSQQWRGERGSGGDGTSAGEGGEGEEEDQQATDGDDDGEDLPLPMAGTAASAGPAAWTAFEGGAGGSAAAPGRGGPLPPLKGLAGIRASQEALEEPPRAPRGTPSSQLPLHAGGYVPSGARGASAAARAADSQPRRRPGDGGGLGDWAGTGGTDDGGFSNWAGTGATSDGGGLGDWAGVGAARAAPLPARSSSYAAGEEGLAREGSWEAASVEEEELQGQVEVLARESGSAALFGEDPGYEDSFEAAGSEAGSADGSASSGALDRMVSGVHLGWAHAPSP